MDYKSSIDERWRLTIPTDLCDYFGSEIVLRETFGPDGLRYISAHKVSDAIMAGPEPWSIFVEKIVFTAKGSARALIAKVLRDSHSFSNRRVIWKDKGSHYELDPHQEAVR